MSRVFGRVRLRPRRLLEFEELWELAAPGCLAAWWLGCQASVRAVRRMVRSGHDPQGLNQLVDVDTDGVRHADRGSLGVASELHAAGR